jgi:DNA helicase HerA-like ATPase
MAEDSNKKEDTKPIGRTSAPEKNPNSSGEFSFWLDEAIRLNPFDFVVARHIDGSKTVGNVTEIYSYSDSKGYLTDFIGSNLGDPSSEPYVERVRTNVAKVGVLRNMRDDDKEELYMPLPTGRGVFYADYEAIKSALGYDSIKGTPIPAGLIHQSYGASFPVLIDSYYLLGPESAHMNITGISGIAGKTSYAMFLLYSVWKTLKKDNKKMSAVIFNVKHADLLHIDEAPTDLREVDKEMFNSLGLPIEQFDNVEYLLPRDQTGNPDSDSPPSNYNTYAFSLQDVHSDLDLLLAELPDPSFTLDAFTSYVRDYWSANQVPFTEATSGGRTGRTYQASTWQDLLNLPDAAIGNTVYHLTGHPTPHRLKRELRSLTSNSGLFVNRRAPNEMLLGESVVENIKNEKISVIDIYRISSRLQPFVVGHVMRELENYYRGVDSEDLFPLVIFIDELNTFAPDVEPPNAITWQIIEIARKGRGRQTSLFGSQQFKSQVHRQVWGNSSLSAIGNVGSEELATPPYRSLNDNLKRLIPGLKQGELVLSFKKWRAPIKITFPLAPYKRPGK